jgi:hypothetical protein
VRTKQTTSTKKIVGADADIEVEVEVSADADDDATLTPAAMAAPPVVDRSAPGTWRVEMAQRQRVYFALDNETPKMIAKKFGLNLKQLLRDNKKAHAGLAHNSELHPGTKMVHPVLKCDEVVAAGVPSVGVTPRTEPMQGGGAAKEGGAAGTEGTTAAPVLVPTPTPTSTPIPAPVPAPVPTLTSTPIPAPVPAPVPAPAPASVRGVHSAVANTAGTCKCGSEDHNDTTHKDCPFKKKAILVGSQDSDPTEAKGNPTPTLNNTTVAPSAAAIAAASSPQAKKHVCDDIDDPVLTPLSKSEQKQYDKQAAKDAKKAAKELAEAAPAATKRGRGRQQVKLDVAGVNFCCCIR